MIVGNDTFPRQRVTPELFALMCGQADNALQLGGQAASAYVTSSSLTTTLGSYVTGSSLSSALGSYVTSSSLSSTLGSYETASAAASLQTKLSVAACPSGQAYSAIAQNGAATCIGAIASAGSFTGALAGDVTGTQGATKVASLAGAALAATAPTSGQVLKYDGSKWAPGADNNSGGTVTGVTSSSAALTVTNPSTTPSLALDGSKITNLAGANIQAGTIPKTAIAAGALSHSLPIKLAIAETSFSLPSAALFKGNAHCPSGTYMTSAWIEPAGTQNFIVTNEYAIDASNNDVSGPNQEAAGGGMAFWIINNNASTVTVYPKLVCMTIGSVTLP